VEAQGDPRDLQDKFSLVLDWCGFGETSGISRRIILDPGVEVPLKYQAVEVSKEKQGFAAKRRSPSR